MKSRGQERTPALRRLVNHPWVVAIVAGLIVFAITNNLPALATAVRGYFVSILAFLFAFGVVLLYQFWRRLQAIERERAAQVQHPAGLAHPRTLVLARDDDQLRVTVDGVLYSIAGARESPIELLLTVPGTEKQICQVELPQPPREVEAGVWQPRVLYSGAIRKDSTGPLLEAIKNTMGTIPTKGKVLVEVAVRVPGGVAGALHAASGVHFGWPSSADGVPMLTAEIIGWDGVPVEWDESRHIRFTRD